MRIAADRRHAVIAGTTADADGRDSVELEWELGSPDCSNGYDGWLPFLVVGEADTVRLVEELLRKQEANREG
jgi:hypothetical protein